MLSDGFASCRRTLDESLTSLVLSLHYPSIVRTFQDVIFVSSRS